MGAELSAPPGQSGGGSAGTVSQDGVFGLSALNPFAAFEEAESGRVEDSDTDAEEPQHREREAGSSSDEDEAGAVPEGQDVDKELEKRAREKEAAQEAASSDSEEDADLATLLGAVTIEEDMSEEARRRRALKARRKAKRRREKEREALDPNNAKETEEEAKQERWSCPECTYRNYWDNKHCVMCNGDRPLSEEQLEAERVRLYAEERMKPGELRLHVLEGKNLLEAGEEAELYVVAFVQTNKFDKVTSQTIRHEQFSSRIEWDEELEPLELVSPKDQRLAIQIMEHDSITGKGIPIGYGDVRLDHPQLSLDDGLKKKVQVPLRYRQGGHTHRLLRGVQPRQVQATLTVHVQFHKEYSELANELRVRLRKESRRKQRQKELMAHINAEDAAERAAQGAEMGNKDGSAIRYRTMRNLFASPSSESMVSQPGINDSPRRASLLGLDVDDLQSNMSAGSSVHNIPATSRVRSRTIQYEEDADDHYGGVQSARAASGDQNAMQNYDPSRDVLLRCKLLRCNDLMHVYSSEDFAQTSAYVAFQMQTAGKRRAAKNKHDLARSSVCPHSLDPEWEEYVGPFVVRDFAKDILLVEVRDNNSRPHRTIGKVEIRLNSAKLDLGGGVGRACTFKLKEGQGTITVFLQLYSGVVPGV